MIGIIRVAVIWLSKTVAPKLAVLWSVWTALTWFHFHVPMVLKMMLAFALLQASRAVAARLHRSERGYSLIRGVGIDGKTHVIRSMPVKTPSWLARLLYAPALLVCVSALTGWLHGWRTYERWFMVLDYLSTLVLLFTVIYFALAYRDRYYVSSDDPFELAKAQLWVAGNRRNSHRRSRSHF